MKEILLNLIRGRTEKVTLAVELLKEKFGDINFIAAKNTGQIPKKGFLDAAEIVSYNLHGRGCDVDFGGERIEFDFDYATENHTGFNVGWLKAFLNRHQADFKEIADLSMDNLQTLLVGLENDNRIKFDEEKNLYFLADDFRTQGELKARKTELALT